MEEVIHPVEEVIHTLGILLSALGPNFGLGPGLDNLFLFRLCKMDNNKVYFMYHFSSLKVDPKRDN